MTRKRLLICFGPDPFAAMVRKMIPIAEHGGEAGQQPFRDRILLRKIALRLQDAKHRCARAEDVHRLSLLRNSLEHLLEGRRQGSQPLQALLEIVKLRRFGRAPSSNK